jgi:uncharacterized protein (TIGR02996 family)
MTTEAAFLQAIQAEPADATHKHVFADWLEDHGDPRAHLMRGIVAYQDSLGPGTTAPVFRPFRVRVPDRLLWGQLLALSRAGRLEVAPAGLLLCSISAGASNLATVLRDGPGWDWVTHLRLEVGSTAQLGDILDRLPYPLWIELHPTLNHGEAARLAASGLLAQVRGLHFPGQGMDDEILATVLASPHLANLETLNLEARRLGPRTLEALANGLAGSRLRWLAPGFAPRERSAFARLLHAPWWSGLEALSLLVTAEDGPFLHLLAGSAQSQGLRILELEQPGIGELDVGMLAGARFWPGLQALSLGVPGLRADVARTLLHMLHGEQLQALRLTRYRGVAITQAVAECPYLAGLGHLTLQEETMQRDPLPDLATLPARRLQVLDLWASEVDDRAVMKLADRAGLEHLRHLRLFRNKLGDAGLRTLATLPGLRNLLSLDLAWAKPTAVGIEALARSPHLAGLLNLVLTSAGRSNEARAALHQRFPRVWNLTV